MKNIFITIYPIVATFYLTNAQGPHHHGNYEQLKAQKVAFITERLDLTPNEAQLFWPLYNELEKKIDALKDDRRSLKQVCGKELESSTMSDKEIEVIADNFVKGQLQEAKLLEEYHLKFKKILPPRKILLLYHTENEFKRHLLHQIKGGGGKGHGANIGGVE